MNLSGHDGREGQASDQVLQLVAGLDLHDQEAGSLPGEGIDRLESPLLT